MSMLKGYTYTHNNNEDDYYHRIIWSELQNGALTNHGTAFSFKCNLWTEEKTYHAEPCLLKSGSKWIHKGTIRYQELARFESALCSYKPKVTLSLEKTCFMDSRCPLPKGSKQYTAAAKYGYIATVDVPESYSQEIYRYYAAEAVPFRDRLLVNHKQLLLKMTEGFFLTGTDAVGQSASKLEGKISIAPKYIAQNFADIRLESRPRRFADFDMKPLDSVQQCYGFALALIELYRPGWEQYGSPKLGISINHQKETSFISIDLHYLIQKKVATSSLKSW